LLSLDSFPKRIEGYDISHMQGSDVVASMVVFTNGVSDKANYRKFKTKINKNDDFYNMNETIKRRLSNKNIKSWGLPSLVLIDGGKGQLDAAIKARDELNQTKLPFIGLAKREEQIVLSLLRSNVKLNDNYLNKLGGFKTESKDFVLINLPHNTNLIKLLQRIRDESHRFAVSYHSILKVKRQTASILDDIPGIGPKTRQKLLKKFGSVSAIMKANEDELTTILGSKKSKQFIKIINNN
jgi:excinuclease ABC subunit C